jgi:hypothetical protein
MIKLPIRALVVVAISFFALSCSDSSSDNPPPANPEGGAGGTGVVKGTVTYTGTKTGAMRLALFRSIPPVPPPVANFVQVDAKFPVAYTITAPAGTWQLIGFLDVDNDSPQPNKQDPMVPSQPITIPSNGEVTVDISFGDTAPDGGS